MLGTFERISDHDRDGLTGVMHDLVLQREEGLAGSGLAEQRGQQWRLRRNPPQVMVGEDGKPTLSLLSLTRIDITDSSAPHVCANQDRVCHCVSSDFRRVAARTRHL